MKNNIFCLLSFFMIVLFTDCSRKISVISNKKEVYLSGRWNSTDSRKVSDTMVTQILQQPWLYNHLENHQGKRPVVVVGLILNTSHEHIDANNFIKDIERMFITSQKVKLVQGGAKRQELRENKLDQNDGSTLPETAKKWGREIGADYLLQGSINSMVDEYKNKKLVNYKVNLELTNIESNEVVFIGDKEITKYIQN